MTRPATVRAAVPAVLAVLLAAVAVLVAVTSGGSTGTTPTPRRVADVRTGLHHGVAAPSLSPGVRRQDFVQPGGLRLIAFWEPAASHRAPMPWVAYVHGGGWVAGSVDETTAIEFCNRMVVHGITCFSLDYTLAPRAFWPVQGDQVVAQIAWIRRHGATFHLDPRLGFAVGHSAGGLMAGVAGLTDDRMAGIVSLAGADDVPWVGVHNDNRHVARDARLLVRHDDLDSAYAQSASVIGHVTATTARVPYLLVAERDDPAVSAGMARRLAGQLRARGFPVTLDVFPGRSHEVNVAGPAVAAVDGWLAARIAAVRRDGT